MSFSLQAPNPQPKLLRDKKREPETPSLVEKIARTPTVAVHGCCTQNQRAGAHTGEAASRVSTGSPIDCPGGAIELAIGADPNCLRAGADDFCSGPSFLAPQATFQSDHQIKYDGGKEFKNHIFRYGVGLNQLYGGGFAEFLGLAPAVGSPVATPPCVAAGDCSST
jgi:hypothetical protein